MKRSDFLNIQFRRPLLRQCWEIFLFVQRNGIAFDPCIDESPMIQDHVLVLWQMNGGNDGLIW